MLRSERDLVSLAVSAAITEIRPAAQTTSATLSQASPSAPATAVARKGVTPPEIAKPICVPSASPDTRTRVGNISA